MYPRVEENNIPAGVLKSPVRNKNVEVVPETPDAWLSKSRKRIHFQEPDSPSPKKLKPTILAPDVVQEDNTTEILMAAQATGDYAEAVNCLNDLYNAHISRNGIGAFSAADFAQYYVALFPQVLAQKPQIETLQKIAAHFVAAQNPAFSTPSQLKHYYANQAYLHNMNEAHDLEREAVFNALEMAQQSLPTLSEPKQTLEDIVRYCGFLYTTCWRDTTAQPLTHYLKVAEVMERSKNILNNASMPNNLSALMEAVLGRVESLYGDLINECRKKLSIERTCEDWGNLDDLFNKHLVMHRQIHQTATTEHRIFTKNTDIERTLRLAIKEMALDTKNKPDIYFTRLASLNAQLYMHCSHAAQHNNPYARAQFKQEIADNLTLWINQARKMADPVSDTVIKNLQQQYDHVMHMPTPTTAATTAQIITSSLNKSVDKHVAPTPSLTRSQNPNGIINKI